MGTFQSSCFILLQGPYLLKGVTVAPTLPAPPKPGGSRVQYMSVLRHLLLKEALQGVMLW